ncbi:right-handed parallel beta-helix repeat-containing protein [Myxococcaceae bacterium GXIMD 01537]
MKNPSTILGACLAMLLCPVSAALAEGNGDITCGATLGAGRHVLRSNLRCNPGSGASVLTLTDGARLDLNGHTVSCSGGADTVGITLSGTGARLEDGRVKACATGILLAGGGEHRLRDLRVTDNTGDGISVQSSSDNRFQDIVSSKNGSFGFRLTFSHRNTFNETTVKDNVGPQHCGGYLLFGANDNVIADSHIARNGDVGVQVHSSDRNTLKNNKVVDSNFLGRPTANILLLEDADENTLQNNKLSSTDFGIALDGLNIGCKGGDATRLGCPETTGADNNIIRCNKANDNARFGFAQAPGNVGNVFIKNTARGNGLADFAIDP